ncbi:MAG: NUDIX domain-containing protein [Propionibacteriaceae bacterium]|nr:NUDIX domain-containing protein [Propionibacteriaceae bacterium]
MTPEINVSAVILTNAAGQVLLVRKRGTRRLFNPGGKPEPGETPAQCAARELAEELGLGIAPEELIWLGRVRAEAANEPGHIVVADVLRHPEPLTELPQPRAEIVEARFVDPRIVETNWSPLFTHCIRHLL